MKKIPYPIQGVRRFRSPDYHTNWGLLFAVAGCLCISFPIILLVINYLCDLF